VRKVFTRGLATKCKIATCMGWPSELELVGRTSNGLA
jgi:hypothetical protein